MMLATSTVKDVDQFLKIFSTTSLEKRRHHGSKGAMVYRDPNEATRVWVSFDWTPEGWAEFLADPTVAPIIQEAGHTSKPQSAELLGEFDA